MDVSGILVNLSAHFSLVNIEEALVCMQPVWFPAKISEE